ncbi:FAD-binding protein [Flavobacteriales bacterium]|nr:FAD-binding protein [Flavobacteriales bacterium]
MKRHRQRAAAKPKPADGPVATVEVRLPAEWTEDASKLREALLGALSWPSDRLGAFQVLRKNLDARQRPVRAVWNIQAAERGAELPESGIATVAFHALPKEAKEVHIIGAGPAGLFAALQCIGHGLRPVIIERGQPVRIRRRDLVQIYREHKVDPDSNYCFGEGGAGTYSDGKLYTRSHKRGDIRAALELLVQHGADENILVEAHPHIGTNKLPGIIKAMRETILKAGGVIHFGCRLIDFEVAQQHIRSITWLDLATQEQNNVPCAHLILATGHSAKDIFQLLDRKGVPLIAKSFAMGVRIEHPQSLIDQIQYHSEERGTWLPPASYRLVCQADGRGVHSFCMCPGGIIAPCATEDGEVVTNGWSPSKRNNPFANSGMVVQLDPEDWERLGFRGPLGGLHFQSSVEKACWAAAGESQKAPAQRLVDFLNGTASNELPKTSYLPGVVPVNLNDVLPPLIVRALKEGLQTFVDRKPAFLSPDAVLVAPESRTSSPVRIPRNAEGLAHPEVQNLFPCGEGGGYAGGILSAAMDGIRVADAICKAV